MPLVPVIPCGHTYYFFIPEQIVLRYSAVLVFFTCVLCVICKSDEKSDIESSLFLLVSNVFLTSSSLPRREEESSTPSLPMLYASYPHRVALLLSHHLHDDLGK